MTAPTFKKAAYDAAHAIMADLKNRKGFDGKLPGDTQLMPQMQDELFARIEGRIFNLVRQAHQPLVDEIKMLVRRTEAGG